MNDIGAIEAEFGDLSAWREAPDFWLSKPANAMPFIEGLPAAAVRTIGQSAGGRDIIAIEYGDKEPLETTTDNLQSALAAKIAPADPTEIFPDCFYGAERRRKPVVVLQGAIHGGEVTGTVASLNLCQIIETGKDVRGKSWPKLQELARETRLCIIPWMNPDGTCRWPLAHSSGLPGAVSQCFTQGITKDGVKYRYPQVKKIFPIPVEEMAFVGTYYNDAGVNLQYDFCRPQRQPETVAWMEYYLDERPDGIVVWHCNAGSLMGSSPYYLPPGHQFEETRLAGAVRARLLREGFKHPIAGRLSWAALPGMGKPFLEQISATYHVCGGLPMLCELPNGGKEWYCSCDDMLDLGLFVIEEILAFAHSDGLRPYEFWEKVKKKTKA